MMALPVAFLSRTVVTPRLTRRGDFPFREPRWYEWSCQCAVSGSRRVGHGPAHGIAFFRKTHWAAAGQTSAFTLELFDDVSRVNYNLKIKISPYVPEGDCVIFFYVHYWYSMSLTESQLYTVRWNMEGVSFSLYFLLLVPTSRSLEQSSSRSLLLCRISWTRKPTVSREVSVCETSRRVEPRGNATRTRAEGAGICGYGHRLVCVVSVTASAGTSTIPAT
jgi:hypothetical protein